MVLEMRVFHAKPQTSYLNGTNMCCTASVAMCLELLGDDYTADAGGLLSRVMQCSSNKHACFDGKPVNTTEVLTSAFPELARTGTCVTEYIVDEQGCTDMTSCLIQRKLLLQCLAPGSAAVLTCGGHCVCISQQESGYNFFDPLPSLLMLELSRDQLEAQLDCLITGQCDLAVIKRAEVRDSINAHHREGSEGDVTDEEQRRKCLVSAPDSNRSDTQ